MLRPSPIEFCPVLEMDYNQPCYFFSKAYQVAPAIERKTTTIVTIRIRYDDKNPKFTQQTYIAEKLEIGVSKSPALGASMRGKI